jgi:hypothetical protein
MYYTGNTAPTHTSSNRRSTKLIYQSINPRISGAPTGPRASIPPAGPRANGPAPGHRDYSRTEHEAHSYRQAHSVQYPSGQFPSGHYLSGHYPFEQYSSGQYPFEYHGPDTTAIGHYEGLAQGTAFDGYPVNSYSDSQAPFLRRPTRWNHGAYSNNTILCGQPTDSDPSLHHQPTPSEPQAAPSSQYGTEYGTQPDPIDFEGHSAWRFQDNTLNAKFSHTLATDMSGEVQRKQMNLRAIERREPSTPFVNEDLYMEPPFRRDQRTQEQLDEMTLADSKHWETRQKGTEAGSEMKEEEVGCEAGQETAILSVMDVLKGDADSSREVDEEA